MKMQADSNLVKYTARLLAILSPVILFVVVVHMVFGWSIFDYMPLIYNDEIGYWHQILTFSEVGLDGGYYGPNEKTPPLTFLHFGAHGPIYPFLYGTISFFTGWNHYSHTFINMVLVVLALWVFSRSQDTPDRILTAVGVATFWPVALYLGSTFQESLNDVGAIIFATLFSLLIKDKRPKTTVFLILASILLFGLLRYTWGILFLPLAWYLSVSHSSLARLTGLVVAILLFFLLVTFFSYLVPTDSYKATMVLQSNASAVFEAIMDMLSALANNFVVGATYLLSGKDPVGLLLATEILLILGISLVVGLIPAYRGKQIPFMNQFAFHFFNLVPISLGLLVLDLSFERVVSAHLLLSLLLIIKLGPRWVAGVLIAINLLATPVFIQEFERWWIDNYQHEGVDIYFLQQEVATVVSYQGDLENPWCNTILIPVSKYDERVLAIPAGIGIAYNYPKAGHIEPFPRSRYLLGEKLASSWGIENFSLLRSTPIGNVYLNKRSSCEVALP